MSPWPGSSVLVFVFAKNLNYDGLRSHYVFHVLVPWVRTELGKRAFHSVTLGKFRLIFFKCCVMLCVLYYSYWPSRMMKLTIVRIMSGLHFLTGSLFPRLLMTFRVLLLSDPFDSKSKHLRWRFKNAHINSQYNFDGGGSLCSSSQIYCRMDAANGFDYPNRKGFGLNVMKFSY